MMYFFAIIGFLACVMFFAVAAQIIMFLVPFLLVGAVILLVIKLWLER